MHFTRIDVPELSFSQRFLTLCHESSALLASMPTVSDIIIDHRPSTVMQLQGQVGILKMVKARTWHEYVKSWWARNRLFKEVRGNRLLQRLGLRVPELYEVGINPLPSRKGYLGYFVMEDLSKSGADEVYGLLERGELTGQRRERVLANILKDIQRMQQAGVIFSDCHLRNIFVDQNDQIIWIDTGVTRYLNPEGRRFRKKFNYAINRFATNKLDAPVRTEKEAEQILSQMIL